LPSTAPSSSAIKAADAVAAIVSLLLQKLLSNVGRKLNGNRWPKEATQMSTFVQNTPQSLTVCKLISDLRLVSSRLSPTRTANGQRPTAGVYVAGYHKDEYADGCDYAARQWFKIERSVTRMELPPDGAE
jgi:hypothetical protein